MFKIRKLTLLIKQRINFQKETLQGTTQTIPMGYAIQECVKHYTRMRLYQHNTDKRKTHLLESIKLYFFFATAPATRLHGRASRQAGP